MRVVVVGGTGNISRGVVKSLIAHGHEVTLYNRGRTEGTVPHGVRVLRGDRKDLPAFEATMRAERFDAAVDMICYTREEAESDVRAFRGVKHFVHTSTVATFGGPLRDTPTSEQAPRNPVIPYGRAKVETDEVFARSDLPYTIFMPAQTWGYQPRLLRQLGLTSHWIDRVRRGLPVLVSHDGQLVWSECHADDAGAAYGAALGRERCLGQSYILTRPGFRTWRDYHDAVGAALGKTPVYVDVPADLAIAAWPEGTFLLRSESRWNRIYDTSKIRRDIPEFRPTITLEEAAGSLLRDLDARGLIPDAREDTTEDRIVAGLDRLARDLSDRKAAGI